MDKPTRVTINDVTSPIYHIHNTSSTLDLAAALLADKTTPTPHLTTIIADHQHSGRGRLNRTWNAPAKQALLASTIVSLPSSFPTETLGWLVYACALAIRDAISARLAPLSHSVCLKWPNDILIDDQRKICGILAQLAPASSPFTTTVILGYGINIAQRSADLPTPQATSLYEEGDTRANTHPRDVSHELLRHTLTGLDTRIRHLVAHRNPHTSGLADEATAALPMIGRRITLANPTDPTGRAALEGTALGLSPTGSLLVRTDNGRTLDINAGDVTANGTSPTTDHTEKDKRANN